MLSPILRGLAAGFLWADGAVERLRAALIEAAAGFFLAALSPEEQSAVSVRVYERVFRRSSRRALADWEKTWFARRLPAPPAHLLVGAAGQGVEVIHLLALGYQVDALEPTREGAHASSVAGAGTVCVARYEDLARAVIEGWTGPASELSERRYDAIVLGWGSLSHVLRASERARLLRACGRLAPRGPILASFFELMPGGAPTGRARALGSAAGLRVRRARGLDRDAVDAASGLQFGFWFGFARSLSREEIDALGRQEERRVIWETSPGSGYPHVTFDRASGSAD